MGSSNQTRDGLLLVSNYKPDVGFAWWLMENFWIQATALARKHNLKSILVYPEPGAIPQTIASSEIEVLIQPFPGGTLRDLWHSIALVRSRRIRYVYFTDRAFASFFYVLLRMAGVKAIVNHDHTPGDRPPLLGIKGLFKSLWHRWSMATCNLQLCVSPLIQTRAIENGKIPSRKAVVVQNGITPIDCHSEARYAHREFDLQENARICVTVGRASRYKRLDFIIRVAQHCIVEHGRKDLVFIHCGDGPDMQRLELLVANAGLSGQFLLAGRRSDVSEILCSADYAIHAAVGEAFSLAILEYMSAGLAVLVPDIPSVCQAVSHGETGLIYPDHDSEAAARLLLNLMKSDFDRRRLGAAAAKDVRQKFTLDQTNLAFRSAVGAVLPQTKD